MNTNGASQCLSPWGQGHGNQCACQMLAAALRVGSDAVTFSYCSALKKRWTITCNHAGMAMSCATPEFPPHDSHDKVHAILVANAHPNRG